MADGQIVTNKVKSKGTAGLTFNDLVALVDGSQESIPVTSFGPTLTKFGEQNYITRTIRATAEKRV